MSTLNEINTDILNMEGEINNLNDIVDQGGSCINKNDLQTISTLVSNISNKLQSYLQNNVNVRETELTTKMKHVEDIQDEAKKFMKDEKNNIKEETINKRRLIQNNLYYNRRYQALVRIVQIIIIVSILTYLTIYLNNWGYISETIGFLLPLVIIAIGLFTVFYLYVDILRRNPLDYDEFNWKFTPPLDTKLNTEGFTSLNPSNIKDDIKETEYIKKKEQNIKNKEVKFLESIVYDQLNPPNNNFKPYR